MEPALALSGATRVWNHGANRFRHFLEAKPRRFGEDLISAVPLSERERLRQSNDTVTNPLLLEMGRSDYGLRHNAWMLTDWETSWEWLEHAD